MIQKQNVTLFVKTIAVCMLILIMTVMVGCSGTKDNDAGIISSENIDTISVELFDGSKRTLEGDAISQFAEMINKAKFTREKSVQDAPDTLPLGKIIINNGKEVIYYYQKNDKYYIEKPYLGIYETTVDINTFLSEL